jgi:hypothetical protein
VLAIAMGRVMLMSPQLVNIKISQQKTSSTRTMASKSNMVSLKFRVQLSIRQVGKQIPR